MATTTCGCAGISGRAISSPEGRFLPTAPMNVEDVIEASAKVLSPALEAALDESGGRFTLNSRTLRQLADAGVSPNVIDVMVAQAYPDRFEVERPSHVSSCVERRERQDDSGGNTTVILGSAAYPYPMYDPFYSSYYYYSPFAYPYYWGSSYFPIATVRYYGYGNYYNNFYHNYPGSGFYGPSNPGSGGTAQPGSPDSRGGDGSSSTAGATRACVRPDRVTAVRAATPTQRSAPSGRGVRSVNSGSDSSSSSSSSSSGSSGGSVSGAGHSSGGNSGGGDSGGGRTAQPR